MVFAGETLRTLPVAIRQARQGDERLIADVYGDDHLPAEDLASRVYCQGEDILDMQRGRRLVWFAIHPSGIPVGTVQLKFFPDHTFGDKVPTAELHYLKVRRSFEGQGVASGLNTTLEEAARARGFRRLVLAVRTHNKRAIDMYKHWGYINAGEIKWRFPAYLMTKYLNQSFPAAHAA